ncbi:hypothetical protein L3Q82_019092, partial [Scortum barcoo]
MPRSKEIQEQMRKKVIEIYQSGKGYKAISKALGLQRKPQKHLDDPQDFWENTLWTDETKVELFG